MSRQMHLVAFLMSGPTSHHHGMWRHPETVNNFLTPAYWESVARTLEDGKFDALFFADTLGFLNETILERGGQMAMLDPLTLLAVMSRVTDRIGLGATLSTSFVPPYTIARALQSLDVISGGRIAWNVITSAGDSEARIFGMDGLPQKEQRYDRAHEVLEACTGMWKSWMEEALVVDKESGEFAVLDKVAPVDYKGDYISVKGRFQVPPSPQGHPVIMQAGSSPRGRDFAAEWAELIFTLQHSLADMQVFYKDIKGRLSKFGRAESDCAILTSVDPIIGETEEIARAKQAYVNSLVDTRLGIALASAHSGIDLSQFPPDEPIDTIVDAKGSSGSVDVILQGARQRGLTLGEAAREFATSELCPQVVGTPESVADQLEEFFVNKGCDGFILTPTEMPGSFEAFTRSVVPILQKRGLFRKDYAAPTLRGNLRSV